MIKIPLAYFSLLYTDNYNLNTEISLWYANFHNKHVKLQNDSTSKMFFFFLYK